jgi:multidrug transporter EmrE-like cation transporter
MNNTIILFVFILLIVISESIAQNYIKKGSINGNLRYLVISVFFYMWICIFLYKLYKTHNMGSTFVIWSVTSSLSIYLLGHVVYQEKITTNDFVGFVLCMIGLYLIYIQDH